MGIKSLLCSHRCDREIPVWCGCRSLILAGELQRNGGKSHCHLSSCCLKDILSQGHWEGLWLRILLVNFSDFLNLFFQVLLDQLYVFDSGRCSWNPFSELRYRLCFFILNGSSIFRKKRRLPEKDSLS